MFPVSGSWVPATISSLQPRGWGGVLIWMQAERAPFVGIALAVVVLVVETVFLLSYIARSF